MRTSKHRHWRYRPTLRDRVEEAAARVIESVSKTCPADAALRKFFRSGSSFEKDHSSDIAGAVFAYYRWLGWCDQEATKSEQVRVATTLALEFSKTPQGFKNAELKAKVVPGWVHDLIKPPPSWWRNLQSPAAIFLRQRRSAKGSFGELELKDVRPGPRSALEFLGTEDLYRHRGFQSGDFDIQDVSSQAVSEICAPQPGEKWWDLCAGGGGKTMHLSDLMQNKGLVFASDRSERRIQTLKRRLARAGVFNCQMSVMDPLEDPRIKHRFDGILVDAPCSGFGTWARNPHARWTTTRADVDELAGIQQRLLEVACKFLKPGGRLVYSVCTMTEAETEGVCDKMESRVPELEPCAFGNPFRSEDLGKARLFLWPEITRGGGMFIASWRKR